MRIIFLGTPDFAVEPLMALAHSQHEILAVVTQPDAPNKRGKKVEITPVKKAAQMLGLKVLQFERIKAHSAREELKALKPDIMITAAYGQILSRAVIDIAPKGIINIHASLLPKYRGAAPVQWAIMKGETTIGLTIMQTNEGIDTGDIILQKPMQITNETSKEALEKLSKVGAEAMIEALELIQNGKAQWIKQDHGIATHFPMLRKTDGEINFSHNAQEICCQIRALNPWPCAYTYLDNQIIKIWSAEIAQGGAFSVGEVISANEKDGLVVACANGAIRILELQRESGKRLRAADFLRGFRIAKGAIFCGQL